MAEVIRFINTASSAGGDGTTNNTSGSTRAYNNMVEWEAAEQTNLVTDTDTHRVKCAGGADSNFSVSINGWTTDATHFITIEANRDESDGFNTTDDDYSTSHYRMEFLDSSSGSYATASIFQIREDYTVVDGLQIKNTYTGGNLSAAVYVSSTKSVVVKNCRLGTSSNDPDALGVFVLAGTDNVGDDCKFYNNIIFNTTGSGGEGILIWDAFFTDDIQIYNNTIDGYDTAGIKTRGTAVRNTLIKNNAVINSSTNNDIDDNGTTSTLAYNATEDGVGSNAQTISDVSATFTNQATGDYTVKDASSVLKGNGIGSGSDSNVPTTDILGDARSTSAPSIGAFEFPAVASVIDTHQKRMSAMNPRCPWRGPRVVASEVGFNEGNRRAGNFSYSLITVSSGASVQTKFRGLLRHAGRMIH